MTSSEIALPEPPVFEADQAFCDCARTDAIAAAYEASLYAQNDTGPDLAPVDTGAPETEPTELALTDDGAPVVFYNGGYVVYGLFWNVLSDSDASSLISLSGPSAGASWAGDGYWHSASFDGGRTVDIWVSNTESDGTNNIAAQDVVDALGRMPLVFLDYVSTVYIHGNTGNGVAASAAFWNNDLNIYAALYTGGLEEVLVHEFGHLVVDEMMAYDPALRAEWQAAQEADGIFISRYGEAYPDREDAAESLLTYIMVRLYPDRVGADRVADFEITFQHRFDFFDSLGLDFSTAGLDMSFQANNNYFRYVETETGGAWDADYNLLENDYGFAEGDLQIVAVNGTVISTEGVVEFAQGGSVRITSDGRIDFDAQGSFTDWVGGDRQDLTFTYTVQDSAGNQDTADATLIVQKPPQPVLAGAQETFENGAADWSDTTVTVDQGNGYLGGFDGTDFIEKTYIIDPTAVAAQITFDFLEIDSWDNESLRIYINGQEIDLGTFAWNVDEAANSFTVGDITITKVAQVDIAGYGNGSAADWFSNDGLHAFTVTVENPTQELTLGFSTTLSSGIADESWGLDNVTVTSVLPDNVVTILPTDARWSDAASWDDGLPSAEDIVIIGEGQKVVLDTYVKVGAIIVDGGILVVEDTQDLKLAADWISVINDGVFQAGTEQAPLVHNFQLTVQSDGPGAGGDIDALLGSADQGIIRAVPNDPDLPPVTTQSVTVDTAARSWDYQKTTYDAAGQQIARETVFDDGRVATLSYENGALVSNVTVDADDTKGWVRLATTYDGAGNTSRYESLYDDGRETVTTYVDGVRAQQTVSDLGDSKSWTEIVASFDANGAFTERSVSYDDGRISTTTYVDGQRSQVVTEDVLDTKSWTRVETLYDENGLRSQYSQIADDGRETSTVYIDGQRISQMISDLGDAKSWNTITTTYTATGQRDSRVMTYDDGRVVTTSYENGVQTTVIEEDSGNLYDWTRITTDYLDDGSRRLITTLYDDGTVVEEEPVALLSAYNMGGPGYLGTDGISSAKLPETLDFGLSVGSPIAGTENDVFYRSSVMHARSLSFDSAVEDNHYPLDPNFAEMLEGPAPSGLRVSDSLVEDAFAFNDFDIAEEVGLRTAVDLIGGAGLRDGALSNDLLGNQSNTVLAGLSIWASDGSGSETLAIGTITEHFDFG